MKKFGRKKTVVYIDEANINLLLRKHFRWLRKSACCSVKLPTSQGKLIHVIGTIIQTGLLFSERRIRLCEKKNCCNFLKILLRNLQEITSVIVVVFDTAPVHVYLEIVSQEKEFLGFELVWLAPYSASLSSIEEVWSILRIQIRS